MIKKRKMKKEETNSVQKIFAGITVSALVASVSTGLFAIMIYEEIIPEGSVGYCSLVTLLISSITGASVATSKCGKEKIYISLIIGIVYCALLMTITALFFGGEFRGIWVTIMVVLSGCMIAIITKRNRNNHLKLRRNKIRPR